MYHIIKSHIGGKNMSLRENASVSAIENSRKEIEQALVHAGKTDLFHFIDPRLDEFFFGGFGHQSAFTFYIVAGKTNTGKSMFVQNMIAGVVESGKRWAYLVLEDSRIDTFARLEKIIGKEKLIQSDKIIETEEDVEDLYSVEDALDHIEYLYDVENCEVVFLDHLQFLFESIDQDKKTDPIFQQRYLMRKLNKIVKLRNKTLICVSHVNKGSEKENNPLDLIIGSSALSQAATNVIYIKNDEDGIRVQMPKSRYTKRRLASEELYIQYDKNLRVHKEDRITDEGDNELAKL